MSKNKARINCRDISPSTRMKKYGIVYKEIVLKNRSKINVKSNRKKENDKTNLKNNTIVKNVYKNF